MRPADTQDLSRFMAALDPATPVLPVGVGSNLIVRDGGVPGAVVRLPKAMAKIAIEPGHRVRAGAGAMGITGRERGARRRDRRARVPARHPPALSAARCA